MNRALWECSQKCDAHLRSIKNVHKMKGVCVCVNVYVKKGDVWFIYALIVGQEVTEYQLAKAH